MRQIFEHNPAAGKGDGFQFGALLISTLCFLCQALLLEERANIEQKVELSELLVQEQSPLPKC